MTWSIRTRLTAWYLVVVVVVLVIGAVTAAIAQRRLAIERLDEDLDRTMATLVAVMRNEFGEGMDAAGAAAEASQEVVAPDRTLAILGATGRLERSWGLPLVVPGGSAPAPERETVRTGPDAIRVRRLMIDDGPTRQFTAVVAAPLEEIEVLQADVIRAMTIGVGCALLVAGAGGWLIGRKTLAPLEVMAQQAQRVNASDPHERLVVGQADREIGQLATAFNGLLDRLMSALTQQRQFMADASHELRTPVSVIRTAAQVTLSQSNRSESDYRESFGIVAEQAARLARLVDDMFLLSRAEVNGVSLRVEFVELDEIVAESVRALRVLADQRGVRVTQGGAQEVGFMGDGALLQRLVTNLLDNAIRHAARGGTVEAAIQSSDGHAVLRVTNDGESIPAADHERIFERFVRSGGSGGAGLGLPIARWIAAAHHGRVELESSDGRRTVFSVTLPIDPSRV